MVSVSLADQARCDWITRALLLPKDVALPNRAAPQQLRVAALLWLGALPRRHSLRITGQSGCQVKLAKLVEMLGYDGHQ